MSAEVLATPLPPEDRQRVGDLLDEVVDLKLGLEKLLADRDVADIPAATAALMAAMDTKLSRAVNLVVEGVEDA